MLEPGTASTTVEDGRDEICVPPHYMKEPADNRAGKNNLFLSMLRIREIYPGSRIRWSRRLEYRIPDPDLKTEFINNLSIF
jgi:hypothetical protein